LYLGEGIVDDGDDDSGDDVYRGRAESVLV